MDRRVSGLAYCMADSMRYQRLFFLVGKFILLVPLAADISAVVTVLNVLLISWKAGTSQLAAIGGAGCDIGREECFL